MDYKWADWDKPVTIQSLQAMLIDIDPEKLRMYKPGAFKFNDGTTQGWKIDQLYDANAKTLVKIPPYTFPATGQFFGFVLSNSNNLALAASANPFMLPGYPQVSMVDFYLESPDLAANPDWKNLTGYSMDFQRNFFSLCVDPPYYFIQMQAVFWDTQQGKMAVYGEKDPQTGAHKFTKVDLSKNYHLIWTADVFSQVDLQLRYLRIRCSMPAFTAPGAGECLPKGDWLFGNITPE